MRILTLIDFFVGVTHRVGLAGLRLFEVPHPETFGFGRERPDEQLKDESKPPATSFRPSASLAREPE
jgi:hypothetical protein